MCSLFQLPRRRSKYALNRKNCDLAWRQLSSVTRAPAIRRRSCPGGRTAYPSKVRTVCKGIAAWPACLFGPGQAIWQLEACPSQFAMDLPAPPVHFAGARRFHDNIRFACQSLKLRPFFLRTHSYLIPLPCPIRILCPCPPTGTPDMPQPTGINNTSKPGLWGGTVSTLEFRVNVTQEMNGQVYTCQSANEALQRSAHEAVSLDVLCKYVPPNCSIRRDIQSLADSLRNCTKERQLNLCPISLSQ